MLKVFEKLRKLKPRKKKFLKNGYEELDPIPAAISLGLEIPSESLEDKIHAILAKAMNDSAQTRGFETIEDANDFEVDEDGFDEMITPYEIAGFKEVTDAVAEDIARGAPTPEQPAPRKVDNEAPIVQNSGTPAEETE